MVLRVRKVAFVQLKGSRRRVRIKSDEGRIVQGILEEVCEIIDLIATQAEARLRTRSAGVGEPSRERGCRSSHRVLRYTGIEVLHYIPDFCERAVMEEGSGVFELP